MITANYTLDSLSFGRNGKEALRGLGKKPKLPHKKMKKPIETQVLEEIKPQFIESPNLTTVPSNLSSRNKVVIETLKELVSSDSAKNLYK